LIMDADRVGQNARVWADRRHARFRHRGMALGVWRRREWRQRDRYR
jgi:hypothetical protein